MIWPAIVAVMQVVCGLTSERDRARSIVCQAYNGDPSTGIFPVLELRLVYAVEESPRYSSGTLIEHAVIIPDTGNEYELNAQRLISQLRNRISAVSGDSVRVSEPKEKRYYGDKSMSYVRFTVK